MSWNLLGTQSGQVNIIDLAFYNGDWYGLLWQIRIRDQGGGVNIYYPEVGFYKIHDLSTMSRTLVDGPYWLSSDTASPPLLHMYWFRDFEIGSKLIEFNGKLYFALGDRTGSTDNWTYTCKVYCLDGNAVSNIHNESFFSTSSTLHLSPNDMCVHGDYLIIVCTEFILRVDLSNNVDSFAPYSMGAGDRSTNGGACDYVSVCSHDNKIFISAAIYGLGSGDTPAADYDEFRLMVSTDNGANFSDVTSWGTGTYGLDGDNCFINLTSFNGYIYMTLDTEFTSHGSIWKFNGISGAPAQILAAPYGWQYFAKLFTSSFDPSRLYVGGKNAIHSIDTSDTLYIEQYSGGSIDMWFFDAVAVRGDTMYWVCMASGDLEGWTTMPLDLQAIYRTASYSKTFETAYAGGPWSYVGSQECEFNIDGLVCYNNHYYMLCTDYINKNPGSSFEYRFYEVLDLESMSRYAIGGPWYQEYYTASTMWLDGNYRGQRHLIIYRDKIYFALRDQTGPPVIYTTRIFCFDPGVAGAGSVNEVFSASVSAAAEYYDAWPNDVCIHNDKLFFSCCEQLIRFDGTTWTTHEPYVLPLMNRRDNYGYCDYVSLCSHQGALYLSVEISGLGEYHEGYYEFKIMVSYDDGDSFVDVSTWLEDTYAPLTHRDGACNLVSFNGDIYATIDNDFGTGGLYKLDGGTSAPSLIALGSTQRMYSFLFTTRYDYEDKLYIGSYNKIMSMNTSGVIVTEVSCNPVHPTPFINAFCDNEITDTLYFIGGDIGWVSGVNPVDACGIYYTEAYKKLFTGYSTGISIVIEGETLIPIDYDPDNPTYFYGLLGHLTFSLHEVSVSVTWIDSITFSPATLKQKLQYKAVSSLCESISIMDFKHCTITLQRADVEVDDAFTHHVSMLHFNLQLHVISISIGTQLGGPSCKAIWNFESDALTVDSKGHNDLINNYYVTESIVDGGFVRGECAANFNSARMQYFEIADANLGVGFPLKSDDANKLITVCYWMKPLTVATTARVFCKYNATINKRSFAIGNYVNKVRVAWGTGTSLTNYTPATPLLVAEQWYHVAVVADGVNKSLHIRIWDAVGSTVYDYTYIPSSELYIGDGSLCIGSQEDFISNAFNGVVDELVVFNSLLSSGDIDAIRTLGITEFGDNQTFIVIGVDVLDTIRVSQFEVNAAVGAAIKETLQVSLVYNTIDVCTSSLMEVESLSLTSTQFEVYVLTGAVIGEVLDFSFVIGEAVVVTSAVMEVSVLSLTLVIKPITITTEAVMEVSVLSLTSALHEVKILLIIFAPKVSLVSTLSLPTAVVVYNNNVYTDPCCKALWRFERNAMLVDSVSTNTLTMTGTPVIDIADYKEGGSSVDFEYTGSTQYLSITDANLSAGFPLKNGDTSKKFTWCFWMKQESQALSPSYLISKYHNTGKRSFSIQSYSNKIQAYWGYSNGTLSETVTTNLSIVNGEWYHIGVAVDGIAKTFYIRIFRASNSAITTYSHTQTNELAVRDAAFRIANRDGDTTYRYDGKLDEVVIFNSVLSPTSIDAIRGFAFHAALYSAPLLDLQSTVVAYDVTILFDYAVTPDTIHSLMSLGNVDVVTNSTMEVELLGFACTVNEVNISTGALVSETFSLASVLNEVEILFDYVEVVDTVHVLASLNNVPFVNNFADNPNCIGLWNFETDFSASLGSIVFSNVAGVTISTEVPYADILGSAYFNSASNQSLEVTDSNLPNDFPLKSTNEDQLFSVCFWAYIVSTSSKPLVAKTNSTGGGLGVIATSTDIMIQWGNTLIDTGIPTIVGSWGHYAVVADVKNNRLAVSVYNVATGQTSVIGTKAAATISLPSVDLKVGNFSDDPPANALEGWISELVMFKELLSTTSIDKIQKGVYKFPTNETNVTNMSTLIGDPSLAFTIYDVTVLTTSIVDVDIAVILANLNNVGVVIPMIIEATLSSVVISLNEVAVLLSTSVDIATPIHSILGLKSVQILSPSAITSTGKGLIMELGLDL
jgi:hypothetical protein